jgi:L-rhamnose-H+ transport protein
MYDAPFVGIAYHAIGGVAHGSFYVPLKRVRGWSWETAWLTQGLCAWLIMPWMIAWITGTQPLLALQDTPWRVIVFTFLFGAMWGAGSLTFGLSVRYLGMSLGMAVALGYTVSLGTLVPPIFTGRMSHLLADPGGRMVVIGVIVCLGGILLCGLAGMRRDQQRKEQTNAVSGFALARGFTVASFSGIMSAGFAFGIHAGQPIAEAALNQGAPAIFKNGPAFAVVMAGGFTVNLIWCLYLGFRNRSAGELLGRVSSQHQEWTGRGNARTGEWQPGRNYFWAMFAGATWYVGFMFYGIGTSFMGHYDFASWSIHLAFVIVFSTACGILAREWHYVNQHTRRMLGVALLVLLSSTVIIALGNRIALPKEGVLEGGFKASGRALAASTEAEEAGCNWH